RRPRPLRRPAGGLPRGPVPLAGSDDAAGCARGVGDGSRRRGDGGAPPRAAGRRRAVPSGVSPHADRPRPGPELPVVTIQEALSQLLDGLDLSRDEARRVMSAIMSGEATPAQIGGFLVALR